MTEDSPQDLTDADTVSEPPADRPRPRPAPSPTSRARRASAAGVEPALRRPRPVPEAASAVALTKTRPDAVAPTEDGADVVPAGGATAADDAPKTSTAHRTNHRSPLWLVAVLVLVLVALGGEAWWLHTSPAKSGSVSQRDQALAAAKTSVPLILSYNYKSFDADQAKAKAQLTGKAQTDYVKAMTTSIKPAAVKAHVVVQASTDGAGVETVSADGDQVTVIVFGEQKVSNTTVQARIDMFRVRAVLEQVGGHWVVLKFNQI